MALTEMDKKDKKEKPMTKVIIRRLPPSMDQETFLNQVSPLADYNYIYTAKGDFSLGEHAFTRVYINFLNPDDVYDFKERFDNYVFVDTKGQEFPAVVEFAPFQRIPKKRGKIRMDPKSGTIESDPIYQEFVESLNKPPEPDEKPEFSLQLPTSSSENKNDVTTPLLEYIKNKRAQRMRIREVRREERKRREFDRRKERFDDRKKPGEEKFPGKNFSKPSTSKLEPAKEEKEEAEESTEVKTEGKSVEKQEKTPEKVEKFEKTYEKSYYNKSKERKYDDRRYDDRKYDDRKYDDRKYDDRKYEDRKYDDRRKDIKPRYPKKEYFDNRDYRRSDDYRPKYDDYKKEDKGYPKKVKKYSERREERKMEVQKAEQVKNEKKKEEKSKELDDKLTSNIDKLESMKLVESDDKKEDIPNDDKTEPEIKPKEESKIKELDSKFQENELKKSDSSESQSRRRIRNKDRPTIAIYRPGMLSKRKQTEGDVPENKESKS